MSVVMVEVMDRGRVRVMVTGLFTRWLGRELTVQW